MTLRDKLGSCHTIFMYLKCKDLEDGHVMALNAIDTIPQPDGTLSAEFIDPARNTAITLRMNAAGEIIDADHKTYDQRVIITLRGVPPP